MRRLAGDARAERLRGAATTAPIPPARLLLLAGLCAGLWLLSSSALWRGGATPQSRMLSADAECEAIAAADDGSPSLRGGLAGQSRLLRPWVQQAKDELSGLTEHVMQLRCGPPAASKI